ncbi:hypothetical protein ACEPAI_8415 [Sanghuangporus weigelae]
MSTAGAISKPSTQLNATLWKVRPKDEDQDVSRVVMFHLTLENAPSDLVAFMYKEFADEVNRGDTYPHEPDSGTRHSREAFEVYFFFAAEVLVAIRIGRSTLPELLPGIDATSVSETKALENPDSITLENITNSRSWKDAVAGFCHVKPNYPALGFSKAGRIPRAGRLKRKDEQGEEYVDAWVLYKSFISETAAESYFPTRWM